LKLKKYFINFIGMKAIIKICVFGLVFLYASGSLFAQCEIHNRVSPDGSMQYYMEPVNFYMTKAKSLKGCIVTDKESYFIQLQPVPFPEKPEGNKLKKDLILKLSDGTSYELTHFDTRYVEKDTVMEMLFLIDKKDIDKLMNFEVTTAEIDMMGTEGIRSYELKLHKSALKEQLSCFLKEQEERKKK
jgi:hypothetical protein